MASDVVMSFDMTRAAVRNALIRLEQEGLVVREPHRVTSALAPRRAGDECDLSVQ